MTRQSVWARVARGAAAVARSGREEQRNEKCR
jgi:hypothetical protein